MPTPPETGGDAPGRRWPVVVAVLCGLAGAALGLGTRASHGARVTGDEPQYLLTAMSLVDDGDLDIADEIASGAWRDFHAVDLDPQTRPLEGGRHVSPHDPGLAVLISPGVAAAGWVGARLTMVALAGALAGVTAHLALRLGATAPAAAVVVGATGASAPLAVYGTQLYPEVPAAVAVTAAVAALVGPGPGGPGAAAVTTTAVAVLPWLGVKYVPVAAVLAGTAAAVWWAGSRRPRVVVACVLWGLAGASWLVAHRVIWGGWTAYASGDHFTAGELTVVGRSPDVVGRSQRLVGLLADRDFGLVGWAPVWLVLVPALGAWVATRRGRLRWLPAAVVAAGWLTATFVALTMHGWWWPGRQIVHVGGVAVAVMAWWAGRGTPRRLAVVGILGGVGVLTWVWLAAETTFGDITLVVDFDRTSAPGWRLVRPLLVDLRHPGPGARVGAVAWAVVLGVAAVVAARRARPERVGGAPGHPGPG